MDIKNRALIGFDAVVISVGATEQFGPNLPMPLPFNTSEEHANFKGTVTVSPIILTNMLEEVIKKRTQG